MQHIWRQTGDRCRRVSRVITKAWSCCLCTGCITDAGRALPSCRLSQDSGGRSGHAGRGRGPALAERLGRPRGTGQGAGTLRKEVPSPARDWDKGAGVALPVDIFHPAPEACMPTVSDTGVTSEQLSSWNAAYYVQDAWLGRGMEGGLPALWGLVWVGTQREKRSPRRERESDWPEPPAPRIGERHVNRS